MKKDISTSSGSTPAGLWNEREAAAYLKQQPRTLRLWRHTRGLPHLKITSKVVLYRKDDIDGWLSRHRLAIAA
jgi:hypothetical protein